MAQYSRNDPSSLSFGRRLARAELDASQAKQELAQLKQQLPGNKELQSAALAGDAIKNQRKAAKQMMARADVSLDELSSIDPAALTPMFQEQLRLSKRDAAFREMPVQSSEFAFATPQAQIRFQNWQQQPATQQNFAETNLTPAQLTPFQKWDARQQSVAGRQWNAQQHRSQYDTDQMLAKSKANIDKPKAEGRRIGGVKDLNN